jgi:acyl carrier protein
MRRLLERALGRSSSDEQKTDPVGQPVQRLVSESEASSTAPSGSAEARASVIQALRHRVAEGSGGRLRAAQIHENEQLFDRGYLDSFSYVEFLAFIEGTYHVRIDDSQLVGHLRTIADMADHILRERTPHPR